MRWLQLAITSIIIIVVSIFVVIPMMQTQLDQMGEGVPQAVKQLIQLMPMGLAIVLLVSVMGFISGNEIVSEEEEAYYLEQDDIAVEPGTLKVRDAKKILKIRYAKGEIDSLEYSERMSRL